MTTPHRCELCGARIPSGRGAEVAGLLLCDSCNAGDFRDRLVHRGFRVQSVSEKWHPFGASGESGGRFRAAAALPFDLGLRAHFSTEDWFRRLQKKLFTRELQTGDAAFDQAIYIQTETPEELATALDRPGLRAALMHAVQSIGQPVELRGQGCIGFEIGLDGPSQVPTALRDLAIILHQLEAYAQEQGMPRQPALARGPDLRKQLEHVENTGTKGDKRYWVKALFMQGSTLDDLDPIARLHERMNARSKHAMEHLRLTRCHVISGDLGPLARMVRLRVLDLDDLPSATALPPLIALEQLEELTLARCRFTDLSPLGGLPALRELWLRDTPISDLGPLASIPSLRKLDLRGTRVRDLTPLQQLPQLEILWVEGLDVPSHQLQALKLSHMALELDPY